MALPRDLRNPGWRWAPAVLCLALGCAEAVDDGDAEGTDVTALDQEEPALPKDDAAPTTDGVALPDVRPPSDVPTTDRGGFDAGTEPPDVEAMDLPGALPDVVAAPDVFMRIDRSVGTDLGGGGADVPTVRDAGVPPVDLPAPIDRCAFATCGAACVDTSSDPANCGGCGFNCGVIVHVRSGAIRCVMGGCSIPPGACEPGFADCNAIPSDGCEADLSSPTSCGRCGTVCAEPTPMCAGAAPACSSGCAGSSQRCGATCTNVATDVNNCGACGVRCSAPLGATALCSSGRCDFVCPVGTHACGAACASNTAVTSCGASCSPCPSPPNGTATCAAARCGIACNPGYYASGTTCTPMFCGTGVTTCSGGTYCPLNSTCLSGGGCTCNAGTIATTCSGVACGASCPLPDARCAPLFCGGGVVRCLDGGYCPANSICYGGSSSVCLCLAGRTAITCTGVSCGSSCVFPNWRCL